PPERYTLSLHDALPISPAQGQLQRGRGRAGRDPAAGSRHQPALLHERGGAGGARRVPAEAQAGLLEVPATAVSATRAARPSAEAPSGVRIWLMAARVRTLPAAIAPVL